MNRSHGFAPPGEMLPFEEAFRIVQSRARFLGAERVSLSAALNRVLAQDVSSDIDMPPFEKSAMDGYACRRHDLSAGMRVVETIPAGRVPSKRIGPNECAKIMTGAIVPEGADCVVKVEETEAVGRDEVRFTAHATADNICRKAEDIRVGDIVLRKGDLIRPQHVGVLAAVGCVMPLVARRPRVGILATGDELVEPDRKPEASQIRNSNGSQLLAQASAAGFDAQYHGIGPDSDAALATLIVRAMSQSDVVLLSGGVSMGDFDLVPGILARNGVDLLFRKVAVQPGMAMLFGASKTVFCFGLPGNPISTFVLFEIMVKAFLFKLMGHDFRPPVVSMRLEKEIARKKAARAAWLPVSFAGNAAVVPSEYHGSAHVNSLCSADGLICVPVGVTRLPAGTNLDVWMIR